MSEITTLQLTCHCQRTSLSLQPSSPPPLTLPGFWTYSPNHTRITGSPFTLLAPLPLGTQLSPPFSQTELPITSPPLPDPIDPNKSVLKSHFCINCGTVLYLTRYSSSEEALEDIFILAGALSDPGKVRAVAHMGLEGSPYAAALGRVVEDGLPRFKGFVSVSDVEAGELAGDWEQPSGPPRTELEGEFKGACACGGFSFTISHPNTIPPTDLSTHDWIKPTFTSTTSASSGRLCCTVCFCHTCRRVSGAMGWIWIFTPLALLTVQPPANPTSHGIYNSTPGVRRHWCKRCGAHLFYQARDGSGGEAMWDVALGVLMSEGWRGWVVTRWGEGEEGGEGQGEGKGDKEGWDRRRVDGYIEGWKEGRMSYEVDGEEVVAGFVAAVKKGVRNGW